MSIFFVSTSIFLNRVPDSDVVVAQNRNNLCVWYNINAPDKVSTHKIKGEIEEIERANGRTEVIVDEGINQASYQLEEALIGFGTAVEDRDFAKAIHTLEEQELNPQTEAMWGELAQLALDDEDLPTAERCFAALGNVAKARYLRRIAKTATGITAKTGQDGELYFHFSKNFKNFSQLSILIYSIFVDLFNFKIL